MVKLGHILVPDLKRVAAVLCLLMAIFAHEQAWSAVPPPGTVILNTATADYTDASGTAMPQATGSAQFTVTGTPLLTVALTALPDPVFAGYNITYTITVTNTGDTPLTGVSLADTIPANTVFVSADSGGILSAGVLTWVIGGLGVGESATVHMVVQVTPGTPGGTVISDAATGSSNEAPDATATADVNVTARTQGVVRFTDSAANPVGVYTVGDNIYVMVTDPDQNLDPSIPDTVTVVIVSHHRNPDGTETDLDTITVTLTETGPDTGVFTGSVVSTAAAANPSDGVMSVEPDSTLQVTYTDPLDPVPSIDDYALIDPFGIVFDTLTGAPVADAVVTLIDDSTGLPAVLPQPPSVPSPQPPSVVTGADGSFQFMYVPAGTYHIEVTPGGVYSFPSGVPDADMPPGYIVINGSRGEPFTLSASLGSVNFDLPVDPAGGTLSITKVSDVTTAAIGDVVTYTVKVINSGDGPVTGVSVRDVLPHGVTYVKGSTSFNEKNGPDPEMAGGRELVWFIDIIPPGGTLEIRYSAVVGPDSIRGSGVNVVSADGSAAGAAASTGRASCRIIITEGVFTSKGTVLGKVFNDRNSDGVQQEGERGVPEVVLYMEDGTRVVTDRDGKYSIHSVPPGTHVVKVDRLSLPGWGTLAPVSNRFMGDCGSQFVDMNPSGLVNADFALLGDMPEQDAPAAVAGDHAPDSEQADAAGGASSPQQTDTAAVKSGDPLEERITGMSMDLEILEPADGEVVQLKNINIVVKAPSEAELALYVNNDKVDPKHIGKKIVSKSNKVAIYKFVGVGVERNARSIIRAEVRDPFGNVRGTSETAVVSPGPPAKIEVSPESFEAPADGRTVSELVVTAYDDDGNLVGYPGELTVTTTAGELIGEDQDASEPGTQLIAEGGAVRVKLRSPAEPGEARVKALCGGLEREVQVYFTPDLRPIMAVGVGEAVVGYGNTSGRSGPLTGSDKFDEDLYFWGRGAFFVKGGIGAETLLTASYDSDKQKRDEELFRDRRNDVESEELYPIYGDESRLGYEATSSKELYLRLDRGRSYLLYGDYQTDLTAARLSAFKRTLTGVKADISAGPLEVKGFASETRFVQSVDRFQGKGIAGYYFLSGSPVVVGSELVVVETRDRLQPERVLGRRLMGRWSDYRIEYPTGALLFKEPIESRDADMNPVYIIVSYESEGRGKHYVYGGRASASFLDRVTAGFTGIVEENDVKDNRLLGADVTVKLPLKSTFTAEWARTTTLFSSGNVLTPRTGDAWLARVSGNPVDAFRFNASAYDVSGDFVNPSAFDVARGKKGYDIDASYKFSADTAARARFLREDDRLNGMHNLYVSAGLDTAFKGVKASIEAVHQRSRDRFVPVTSPNTRYPFDISEETPHEMTAIKARLEAKLYKDLYANVEHLQGITSGRLSATTAGLEYRYSELTKLYVREQYARYDDSDQLRTVAGIETSICKDTVGYTEYRLTGAADGTRNQHAIGIRNKLEIMKGLTANFAVENLKTLSGAEKKNEEDGFAASTGLEYLASDETKASTRLEYRDSTSQVSRLAEMGVAYRLHRDLSLMLTGRYFDSKGQDAAMRSTVLARLGFAYRPVWSDKLNALAKAEYRHERGPNMPAGTATDSYLFALEGVYQATKGLALSGKYAGKYTRMLGIDPYTDLISIRGTYDISERFDISLTGRMLTDHLTGTRTLGGSAELGYRLIKNVWLSAGYSFDRFDSDLSGDDYQGGGPFVRVRVKLDESLVADKGCGQP